MTDVPDDIMETAREVYLSLMDTDLYDDHKYGSEHIARAIMAERERCAKVVEMLGPVIDRPSVYMGGPSREARRKVAVIAAAIRKGGTP